MSIQTKEQKIIDKASQIALGFANVYGENSLEFVEYSKILKEYQKLSHRFEKILKMNDMMQNVIMSDKESLEDNLLKMKKEFRKKLLDNLSNQNEMKMEFSGNVVKYQETIIALKSELTSAEKTLKTVLKELLKYKQGVVTHSSETKDFEHTVHTQLAHLKKTHTPFVILKIVIKDFDVVFNKIKFEYSKEELILATLKFIGNCFKGSDVVCNNNDGSFYVLLLDIALQQCGFLHKLSDYKRHIAQTDIELRYIAIEANTTHTPHTLFMELNK